MLVQIPALLSKADVAALRADIDAAEWIDGNDSDQSVVTFLRRPDEGPPALVACNFTPVVRQNYRVGVPLAGEWREILNSDATLYGGSGQGNMGGAEAAPVPAHGRMHSLSLTLPPLAVLFFKAAA